MEWFKLKQRRFRLDAGRKFFTQSGETLAMAAQRNYGCLIPEGIQSQVGWGSRQPDVEVEGAPARVRELELDIPTN